MSHRKGMMPWPHPFLLGLSPVKAYTQVLHTSWDARQLPALLCPGLCSTRLGTACRIPTGPAWSERHFSLIWKTSMYK